MNAITPARVALSFQKSSSWEQEKIRISLLEMGCVDLMEKETRRTEG
jgi:hypothetical protein